MAQDAETLQPQQTLEGATRRYQLRDSSISNIAIAEHLGVDNTGDGSPYPASYFWERRIPYIQVAIRTKPSEIAIFREYDDVAAKMTGIGDEIE